MNNNYLVGDFVTFHESYEIADDYLSELEDDWELAFATCDVNRGMLVELDCWFDNQIASIDDDGDIKFEDFPWTWPVEVISGYSPDYVKDSDGIHCKRIDDE